MCYLAFLVVCLALFLKQRRKKKGRQKQIRCSFLLRFSFSYFDAGCGIFALGALALARRLLGLQLDLQLGRVGVVILVGGLQGGVLRCLPPVVPEILD